MLMNEHDDAYVDAMLMVNMQANTRSVTRNAAGPGSSSVGPQRGVLKGRDDRLEG